MKPASSQRPRKHSGTKAASDSNHLGELSAPRAAGLEALNRQLIEQIAERRQAEDALRESEDRYRSLFISSMDAVLLTIPDGRILAANPAACRMFGLSEEELIRIGRNGIVDSSDPRLPVALEERKRTGKCLSELTMVRGDGTKFIGEVASSVFRFRGEDMRTSMIIRDITERHQSDIALQRREAELRAIYDFTPIMICLLDAERRVLQCNRAFATFVGKPASELQGLRACGVLGCARELDDPRGCGFGPHCPECPVLLTINDTLATGHDHVGIEKRFLLLRGGKEESFVLSICTASLVLENQPRTLLCLNDITASKRAEEALRISEERYRVVANYAYDWETWVGPDGRLIYISPACERITGYRAEEFLADPKLLGCVVHPDDREHFIAHCGKPDQSPPLTMVLRITAPSGGERWLEHLCQPVYAGDGSFLGRRASNRDITLRKQAEDMLHASHEQMRALAIRLQEIREEERTRISSEIHDELGQMLTGLKMDLSWIEHRLEKLTMSAPVSAILEKVVVTSELVGTSIKSIQRIAADLRPGILDRLGLIMALRYETHRLEERLDIACRIEAPEQEFDLPPAVATAFFRIFQEAITNVARHSGASQVDVTLRQEGTCIMLEIIDDGKGITMEDIGRPNSLGILGMQEHARALGGFVALRSREEGGTIVTVSIPVVLPVLAEGR